MSTSLDEKEQPLLRSKNTVIKLTEEAREKFLSAKEDLKKIQCVLWNENTELFFIEYKNFFEKHEEFKKAIHEDSPYQSLPEELLDFYKEIYFIEVVFYEKTYSKHQEEAAAIQKECRDCNSILTSIQQQLALSPSSPEEEKQPVEALKESASDSPQTQKLLENSTLIPDDDAETFNTSTNKQDSKKPLVVRESFSGELRKIQKLSKKELQTLWKDNTPKGIKFSMEDLQRLNLDLLEFQTKWKNPSPTDAEGFTQFESECQDFRERLGLQDDFSNAPKPILEFYQSLYTLKLQFYTNLAERINEACDQTKAALEAARDTLEKYKRERHPKVYHSFLSLFTKTPETTRAKTADTLISIGFGPLSGLMLTAAYASLGLAALEIYDHYKATDYVGDVSHWLDQHAKVMAGVGYVAAALLAIGLIGIILADLERRAINRKNQSSQDEDQNPYGPPERKHDEPIWNSPQSAS